MLAQWWFEIKRKEFNRKKVAFLKVAKQAEMSGDLERATEIKTLTNQIQDQADLISLHYANGGHCLQSGVIWKITSFWSNINNLDDSLKSLWRQLWETIIFVGGTVFLIKRFWFGLYTVPSESAEPNLLMGDRICGVKYPYIFKNPERGDLIIFDDVFFKYSQNSLLKLYQQYVGFGLGPLPAGPEAWTKRVVGLPGDRVKLSINEAGRGEIYVNGTLLPEPNRNPYPVIRLQKKSGLLSNDNAIFKLPIIGWLLKSFFGENENLKQAHRYTFDPNRAYNDQPFYNFEESEVIKDSKTEQPLIDWPEKANPKIDVKPEFTVPEKNLFLVGDNRHGSWDGRAWGTIPLAIVRGRVSFIVFSVDGSETWWFTEFIKNPITFFTKKIRWSRILRFLHPFKEIPIS